MDVTMSGEASAPLPIRQPNSGPYKKQAFPMISKRPEHLRMNLWQNNAFNELKATMVGRGCVSILQGETRRLKMTVSKSQCHDIEHFGQRKIKHGLKKNQSMVQKNLSENSIAELLGTSINWFLATSSQPIKDFHVDGSKLTVLRVGCCFWITVESWSCRRRVILPLGKVWICL